MGFIYNIKYFRCGHIIYDLVSARIQAHASSKKKNLLFRATPSRETSHKIDKVNQDK